MWPGWIDLVLSLDTCLRELKIGLFDIRQRPKDVLLDHGHYIVEVRNDETDDHLLILQVLLDLIDGIKSLSFALDIFGLVLVVVVLLADEQFLLEALLRAFSSYVASICNLVGSARRLALALTRSALLVTSILLVLLRKMLTHI